MFNPSASVEWYPASVQKEPAQVSPIQWRYIQYILKFRACVRLAMNAS
jgi:hypothetical protein